MAGITCKMNCESRQQGRCVLDEIVAGEDGKCGGFREKKLPKYEPISVADVLIYDNVGRPSVMTRLKRVSDNELFGGSCRPHPAFVIDGKVYDEIYVSKYLNTVIDGKAYSVPFGKPTTNITLEDAEKACFDKGEGWHLMTAQERGLIALLSLKNGTLPHGNTNSGKYHGDTSEEGICYDGCRTLAGSGPATWSHDHTPHGIYDLCGDVWEWVRGLRLKDGEIQVCNNNDGAMPIDLSENGNKWQPLEVNGENVYMSVSDGEISITADKPEDTDYTGDEWGNVNFDAGIGEAMKELALFDGEPNTYIYVDTEGERLSLCGGGWAYGSSSGVFNVSLSDPRSDSSRHLGFRSAYYRKL